MGAAPQQALGNWVTEPRYAVKVKFKPNPNPQAKEGKCHLQETSPGPTLSLHLSTQGQDSGNFRASIYKVLIFMSLNSPWL